MSQARHLPGLGVRVDLWFMRARATWRKPKWYVPSHAFDPKTEGTRSPKVVLHSAYEKPKLTNGAFAWTSYESILPAVLKAQRWQLWTLIATDRFPVSPIFVDRESTAAYSLVPHLSRAFNMLAAKGQYQHEVQHDEHLQLRRSG